MYILGCKIRSLQFIHFPVPWILLPDYWTGLRVSVYKIVIRWIELSILPTTSHRKLRLMAKIFVVLIQGGLGRSCKGKVFEDLVKCRGFLSKSLHVLQRNNGSMKHEFLHGS